MSGEGTPASHCCIKVSLNTFYKKTTINKKKRNDKLCDGVT